MSDSCSWCTTKYIVAIGVFLFIYAKFIRKHLSGYLLKGFVEKLFPFFKAGKQQIFEDAFGKLERENTHLNLLEIGVGTGANFTFYPKNCRITILDKTDAFLPYLKQSIKDLERHDLTIEDLVFNPAEHMKDIKPNSFDGVISTFTLCSVEDPIRVFNEINRVLKPGGVFLFMEHSKDTSNSFMSYVHTFMGPVWTFFFGDCRFRSIKDLVKQHSKLDELQIHEYKRYNGGGILSIINPIYYGFGRKTIDKN